jgi:DNA-binding MarR family transcriptional regulator
LARKRNDLPRWRPSLRPSGTDNFANLLRDPALGIAELIARDLVALGHTDVRPALLAVGAHIAPDGSRITELAERAQLTKATVVRTIDELERLGYAERSPDPDDGRAKLVRGTASARAVEADARKVIAKLRGEWAAAMAPGELDQLEALLRKLRLVLWPDESGG